MPVPFEFGSDPGDSLFSRCGIRDGCMGWTLQRKKRIKITSGGANGSTVEVEDALPLDEVTKSEHFKARLGAGELTCSFPLLSLTTTMSSNSTQSSPDTDSPSDDILTSFRPFVSYSQSQILWLYRSPLVSPPNGMPSLKDWFGYASSFMYFAIPEPWHTLGTGMNKTFRKRILTHLLPPQERGTNGGLNLSLVSTSILLTTHLSFRRDQEDAGTVSMVVFRVHPFTYHLVSGSSPARYLPFNTLTTFANGQL
jgi:hypothetical protein